jgi:hypothetical protein
MPIGNYCECVLALGNDTPPLQRIVGEASILFRRDFSSWKFDPDGKDFGGAEFSCLGVETGDLRTFAHVIKPLNERSYLHSAFPWPASGVPTRLTLYRVDTDHFDLEGFLDAGIEEGPYLTFFDPLFALNTGKYRLGGQYHFSLGAFSLNLKLAASNPVRMKVSDTAAQSKTWRLK